MNKKIIKVVKQNKEETAEKPQILINSREIKTDAQTAKVINNWISERSENRLKEKVFSAGKILEWKLCSKILKNDK